MKVNFSVLGEMSVSSYCRKLIKEGVSPDTRLELYRTRETSDVTVSHIGRFAEFIAVDKPAGVRFVKYQPTIAERKAHEAAS